MEEHVKSALEIVKAQASVRAMSAEEIVSMATEVASAILFIETKGEQGRFGDAIGGAVTAPAGDGRKSVREKTITCLECGKSFKVLTKKHLLTHGMTPAEYRAKHGLKKGAALACKALVRDRRAKMKEMALWERKGQKAEAVQ